MRVFPILPMYGGGNIFIVETNRSYPNFANLTQSLCKLSVSCAKRFAKVGLEAGGSDAATSVELWTSGHGGSLFSLGAIYVTNELTCPPPPGDE